MIDSLRRRLGGLVSVADREPAGALSHELSATLAPTALPKVVQQLCQQPGVAFADLFGFDAPDGRRLHVIFALDSESAWLHLVSEFAGETLAFPSLAPLLPAADWYEREIWDELGIEPQGHPALARLRLPHDWPAESRPLGRGFDWHLRVPCGGQPAPPPLVPAPRGVVDYPLGPVRSGVVESAHYTLRTVGEELVDARLLPFYKHRGIEKLAESVPLMHLPLLAERISGTSSFAHSLALCQALEMAAGIDAPPGRATCAPFWPR